MNNSIGSFDNFDNFVDQTNEIESTDGELSSGCESNEDIPSTPANLKGPQVKKTILCEEEFIPMPKNPANTESPEATSPNPPSNATTSTKTKRKKTAVKKNNTAKSNSEPEIENIVTPKTKATKGSRKTSKETSLDSPSALSLKSKNPRQTRVTKRIPTKRAKRRELSEDIKSQLKTVFNDLSKIYFSFD